MIDIVKGIQARERANRSNQNVPAQPVPSENIDKNRNNARVARDIAMRFNRADWKFTSHIGQSWNEFVTGYMLVSRENQLTSTPKTPVLA